jgi:uncharacterized YccA/Bax inhibitor family protein
MDSEYATFRSAPTAAAPGTATQPMPQPTQQPYPGLAVPEVGQRLTVTDVVVKTAVLFGILLATSVVAWRLAPSMPWLMWVGAIGGLILVIISSAKKQASPPVAMLYAAFEGLFVGGISYWYQDYVNTQQGADAPNIVLQAVIGTMAAFASLLALYGSGRIRVTPKVYKMFYVALLAYLGIAVVSVLFAIFAGTGDGFGFYGVGPLGILICAAGVGLAAFSLVIDFDIVDRMVAAGAPERESWRLGLGLIVSLVWLYLELLRLLAILNRN